MSVRSNVLLWANTVVSAKDKPAHQILGCAANASLEDVQETFHKIARTAHPDLHRNGLPPDELELVTTAYAIAAGAYQAMRTRTMQTTRMRRLDSEPRPAETAPGQALPVTPLSPAGAAPAGAATAKMSSKALLYFRKAELCLKRGDLKGAILQIKLAIAADPASAFLRTALAEVELELKNT